MFLNSSTLFSSLSTLISPFVRILKLKGTIGKMLPSLAVDIHLVRLMVLVKMAPVLLLERTRTIHILENAVQDAATMLLQAGSKGRGLRTQLSGIIPS